jgi:DNA-binding Xre family transcriptional regulator
MTRKLQNRLLHLITEKERKRGKRITQTEIARAIGISNPTIGAWLRDDFPPTKLEVGIIERLCDYFECDVGDLLYMKDVSEDD